MTLGLTVNSAWVVNKDLCCFDHDGNWTDHTDPATGHALEELELASQPITVENQPITTTKPKQAPKVRDGVMNITKTNINAASVCRTRNPVCRACVNHEDRIK